MKFVNLFPNISLLQFHNEFSYIFCKKITPFRIAIYFNFLTLHHERSDAICKVCYKGNITKCVVFQEEIHTTF